MSSESIGDCGRHQRPDRVFGVIAILVGSVLSKGRRALPNLALLGINRAYGSLAGRGTFHGSRGLKVSLFHAPILMLKTLGPGHWSLQIIFRPEPSSDLLDHFATLGVVH